ncbi:MAG: hypothetical protein R3F59_25875 [Myxococcota bacterium]
MRWTTGAMVVALCGMSGCELGEMGVLEALDALDQVARSGRGEQATAEPIEISTDFTVGAALQDAAEAVADFWASQAPCTDVTLDGARVTLDYGTLDDDCRWNGHTFAGVNTIEVSSTTPGELAVEHVWDGFTNGDVTVDGDALVTWSGSDLTRRVETAHRFTDGDGDVVDVTGDHVIGRIDDDVPVWRSGFTLDGTRDWTTDRGEWSLDMDGLEQMLLDPAPQAGVAVVTAPSGKTLTITYGRVDDDTVSATLSGVRGGPREYHISRLGLVEEAP